MENSLLDGLTARDYARILFKRKGSIFFIFALSVFMVTAYTYLVLPTYEAVAEVLLVAEKNPPMPMTEKLTPYRQGIEVSATYSEIIKSNAIVADVVKALDLQHRPNPKGLKGFIKVKIDEFRELISDVKRNIKNFFVEIFTGKWPEDLDKPSKFDKEIKRLSSKKVVKIDPLERTDIIAIKVKDYDPRMAAKIANAFANALIVYSAEMELQDLAKLYRSEHPRIVQLKSEIEELRKEMQQGSLEPLESLAGKSGSGEIKVLERAVPPFGPIAPRKLLNVLMAVVISLIAGIFYVFLLEILDQTIKLPSDVSEVLRTRTWGSIPVAVNGNPEKNGNWRHLGSAVNPIASELLLAKSEKGIKCVLVVSTDQEDGKTTMVLNLAEVLAKMSKGKILVISADVRNPIASKMFRTVPGLVDFAEKRISSWKELVQEVPSKGFSVIAGGSQHEHPETSFSSKQVQECLKEAKNHYDFILIDTPGLRYFKDALSFSGVADGAIFVVNTNETRKYPARFCATALHEKHIPLIGAVLNFRKFEIPESIYSKI